MSDALETETRIETMWVTGAVVTCKACRLRRTVEFDPPAHDVDEAKARLQLMVTRCRCKTTDVARVRFTLENAAGDV